MGSLFIYKFKPARSDPYMISPFEIEGFEGKEGTWWGAVEQKRTRRRRNNNLRS